MGMTDVQFKVFIRFLLNAMESAENEKDPVKKERMFQKIKEDLQKALED